MDLLKSTKFAVMRNRADSSRGLGSFVSASVCWQIDFLYKQFLKLLRKEQQMSNILSLRVVTVNPVIND